MREAMNWLHDTLATIPMLTLGGRVATTDQIEGGCLCGTIRYSASLPIIAARQCWCRTCQFLACGNASTNVVLKTVGMTIEGSVAQYRSVADSGNHMVRSFCPVCGTQLFSESAERPGLIVVRGGTLDEPGRAAPEAVIWTDCAPCWALLDDGLPSFPGQPPEPGGAAGPKREVRQLRMDRV